MFFLLILLGALLLYGFFEYIRHTRLVHKIPIRIHVNGSRGKSSVTRLIAAGLREEGISVFAKTTGSSAKFIFENGNEFPMPRVGAPNIHELISILSRGARRRTKAYVIECMAVRPDLQWITEHRMLKSTHGVITNVRPDHLEVMGPTTRDVARALSNTVPRNGVLFTAEKEYFHIFQEKAAKLGTEIIQVSPDEVTPGDLSGFSYMEHRENVALALKVCERLGVKRKIALRGMYSAIPDIGALRVYQLRLADKKVTFIHAFAANDPESIRTIWKNLALDQVDTERLCVLVNLRGDRIHRSGQLAELMAKQLRAHKFVLVGDYTRLIHNRSLSLGLQEERLLNLGKVEIEKLFDELGKIVSDSHVIFGMGNIGGMGGKILSYVAERGTEIGFSGYRPGTLN